MVHIVSHNKTAQKEKLVPLSPGKSSFFIAQETNELVGRTFRCNGNCMLA